MVDEKVGSIRDSNEDSKYPYTYFSYDGSYSFPIIDYDFEKHNRNLSAIEKNYQRAEIKLQQLQTELNNLGYADDNDPIIKFKVTQELALGNIYFVSSIRVAYIDLSTGKIHANHWVKEYASMSYRGDYLSDFDKVIFSIKHLLDHITTEIINQGYEPDNKQIIKLIHLYHKNRIKNSKDCELIGELKDWIPYVYAGVSKEQLFEILKKETNPDYEKTGIIAISVGTAKKLGSIHGSFAAQLTN